MGTGEWGCICAEFSHSNNLSGQCHILLNSELSVSIVVYQNMNTFGMAGCFIPCVKKYTNRISKAWKLLELSTNRNINYFIVNIDYREEHKMYRS